MNVFIGYLSRHRGRPLVFRKSGLSRRRRYICWWINEIESMFGCPFLSCVRSPLTPQRGVEFMQIFHNHPSVPCSHPYHPHLLPLLALSITHWSQASSEWSIMTGGRTQGMMGHRRCWQQSPGSFFKRQRSTSEKCWGRVSEVREAQAPPQGEVMGRWRRTHKSADMTRLTPTRRVGESKRWGVVSVSKEEGSKAHSPKNIIPFYSSLVLLLFSAVCQKSNWIH